jgi:hypothetical protein
MFKRGVTVEKIGDYLKRFGWQQFQIVPEPGEKEGVVLTGWSMGGENHQVAIDPMVEKGSLVFMVRHVAEAPPDSTAADRLQGLLLAMTTLNFKLIIGTWAFDPSDGEIILKAGLPIESGSFEYDDFQHVLMTLVSSTEVYGRQLREILAGAKTAQEVIAAL